MMLRALQRSQTLGSETAASLAGFFLSVLCLPLRFTPRRMCSPRKPCYCTAPQIRLPPFQVRLMDVLDEVAWKALALPLLSGTGSAGAPADKGPCGSKGLPYPLCPAVIWNKKS